MKPIDDMNRRELLAAQSEFEEQLQNISFKLGEARRLAQSEGVYMNHVEFNELRVRQHHMRGMKRAAEKALRKFAGERMQQRSERVLIYNAAFVKAATELFDAEDLQDVKDRATEIMNG